MDANFMNQLMQQAQKVQEDMKAAQAKLAGITVEGTAGGGMVRVTVNCKNEVVNVSIEKEVVDPEDKEMLEDLIVAATNQAMQKAGARAQEEMQKAMGPMGGMMGGLNLPGF